MEESLKDSGMVASKLEKLAKDTDFLHRKFSKLKVYVIFEYIFKVYVYVCKDITNGLHSESSVPLAPNHMIFIISIRRDPTFKRRH